LVLTGWQIVWHLLQKGILDAEKSKSKTHQKNPYQKSGSQQQYLREIKW